MDKRSPWIRCTGALLACLALLGCNSRIVSANNPVAITAEEYDRIFEATVDVLRLNQFRVDRQDRRFGVITTEPLIAASALEPWYTDNTTPYQTADATLNYQRRIVSVHLEPADREALAAAELARIDVRTGQTPTALSPDPRAAPDEQPQPVESTAGGENYQLRVEVMLEQRQLPEQQLHTAAMTSVTYYGRSPDVRSTVTERGVERSFWKPVGRDFYYEQRLVRDILNRSTVISPRTKSREGPTDPGQPQTPELIRPEDDAPEAS